MAVIKHFTVNNGNAIKIFAVLLLLGGHNMPSFAQASVRDSSPISVSVDRPPVDIATPSPVSPGFNLINQLQQLQQEVLELRGLVEEQSFEIKRLKQQRLDDYLDLDKRIIELSKQQALPSGNNTSTTPVLPVLSSASIPSSESQQKDQEIGKALYKKAIDQLLSQQDFSGAQDSFEQYLSDYPAGVYVPNVHYWQGQIYITQSKVELAKKSFLALIDSYPNHQKTPDAKYKLATIYYDQGKKVEAKTMLEAIANSGSDASRLAKSFLSDKY